MTWEFIIIGLVVLMNVIAIVAEFFMHDRNKAREIKLKMKAKQDELKALQKNKDTESLKKMGAIQKEMFSLAGQQMKLQFRSMILTFPIFLIIFWWLGSQDFKNVTFPLNLSWYLFYVAMYILVSALMSPLKNQILWGHYRGIIHAEKLKAKNG